MAEMPNFVPLSTPTPTLPLVQLPRSFGLLVNRPSWPIRRSNAVLKSMSVSPNEPKPNREERRPERHQVGARHGSTARDAARPRSEEHTSELQSLMRISYAVCCLTKKKKMNRGSKLDAN